MLPLDMKVRQRRCLAFSMQKFSEAKALSAQVTLQRLSNLDLPANGNSIVSACPVAAGIERRGRGGLLRRQYGMRVARHMLRSGLASRDDLQRKRKSKQ